MTETGQAIDRHWQVTAEVAVPDCGAVDGEVTDAEAGEHEPALHGRIIIEWTAPRANGSSLPGWGISVYDADTGGQVCTITHLTVVHASAEGFVTADLTQLADADGRPLKPGPGRAAKIVLDAQTGELVTAVFRYEVTEMRVAAQ
jgi:hypothetical protein